MMDSITAAEIKQYKQVLEWRLKGERVSCYQVEKALWIVEPRGRLIFRLDCGAEFLAIQEMSPWTGSTKIFLDEAGSERSHVAPTGRTEEVPETPNSKKMIKCVELKHGAHTGRSYLILVDQALLNFFPPKAYCYWQDSQDPWGPIYCFKHGARVVAGIIAPVRRPPTVRE